MVELGFTGVWDVLDGEHNALQALSSSPQPEEMVAGLGSRFFVTETAIKPFSVGYPVQAPLDAFLTLHREHGLNASNVESIVVTLPEDGARIVNDRTMPDVTMQQPLVKAALARDGTEVSLSASPEQFNTFLVEDSKFWVNLVKSANVKIE